MKRSHIQQQEKTSNNVNSMIHAANDDGKNELVKISLSQDFVNGDCASFYAAARNLEFDSSEVGYHHIYENIPRTSKNKLKSKSLSDFVGNLKFMTRELKIRKYAKKSQTVMIENQFLDERNSSSPTTPKIDHIDDRMNGEDRNSYTSCQEENIYENLNFTFQHNWSENETVCENESLKSWLEQLTFDTVDYETNEIMITKCIPSKHKNILCNFEASPTYIELVGKASAVDTNVNSTLEQYKLDILNKCFAAIWKQETETEVLNNLYVFLNDIFSSFFKRNATQVVTTNVGQTNSPSSFLEVKQRRKSNKNIDSTALCKMKDKETLQRLETFILSVTLNRLTISYDKCMKFYFALQRRQSFCFLGVETSKIFKFVQVNQSYLKLRTRRELVRFLKQLQIIFVNSTLRDVKVKKVERIESVDEVKKIVIEEENIYQPIWNWHSDSKSLDELDDNDWEVDSEFLFVGAKTSQRYFSPNEINMFNTVCILYSEENPELNRILYQYESSSNIINDKVEKTLTTTTCDKSSLIVTSTKQSESPSEFHELDSVTAWKNLLRHSFYCEDEEDLIMSETQIESMTTFPLPEETSTPWLSNDDIRNEVPKSKLITTSNGSYELKSASETSTESSIVGNYRQVSDTDEVSISSTLSAASTDVIEEPKKDRERFRDKMKGKFKLKSSRPPVIAQEAEAVKEVEEEFFGSNLETVEKDSEHKLVPKIVVECVSALEMNANILTPGLYRVSGNKTVIEAFKKKSNDKKSSKKDAKIASLRNQDVHSVTGIIKMFFRELTPPLMPSKTFVDCTSDDVTLEQINFFLLQMPAINYQTLKFLMSHLKRVEEQKEENLMNSGNLAICWGLCVFSSSFETMNSFFDNDISKCNMLCKKMIDHYETIFK